MDYIINLYNNLDNFNRIIFIGIILLILLIIILILVSLAKKKKNNIIKEEMNDDIPINNNIEIEKRESNCSYSPTIKIENIEEEKKENTNRFIAEEHVMKYNNELFSIPNIKKTNEQVEEKTEYKQIEKKEIIMPTKPYERNVLREMSLNQTSPIGITYKTQNNMNNDLVKDLNESLKQSKENIEIKKNNDSYIELTKRMEQIKMEKEEKNNNNQKIKTEKNTEYSSQNNKEDQNYEINNTKEDNNKELKKEIEPLKKIVKESNKDYLEEVSRKLAEAEVTDEIDRTEYELKQEEDAIISLEELMQKKDQIETIDEEEAVISIEELIKKKEKEDKLYKLTDNEENDNFIEELKKFRKDL